jgi:hypothetical protein
MGAKLQEELWGWLASLSECLEINSSTDMDKTLPEQTYIHDIGFRQRQR